ncbi:adenylate kinase [Acrasis kona]|uniref:Adenylate kinase n=1 Tax=Acrasis kona TaxID=1008807 RepID=A0AAW2YMX5_9EUKA
MTLDPEINKELGKEVNRVVENKNLQDLNPSEEKSAIKYLFQKYDLNNDGTIDVDEMKVMIEDARKSEKESGGISFLKMTDSLSDEQLNKVFDSVKKEEEGHINFKEFRELCEKYNIIDSGHVKTQQLMHDLLSQWIGSVEIEDHTIIFQSVWSKLQEKYGTEDIIFPREFLLLGGAPGAGKGTVTPFIVGTRGYTAPPLVMSDLLNSPQAKKIKASGGLVGDFEVIGLLFEKLMDPVYRSGVIIDGFPRTKVQVEVVKLLRDKLIVLHEKHHMDHELSKQFPRTIFRTLMLFVEEKESVERQLMRGHQIKAHNERVLESGEGKLLELRETDISVDLAKGRYLSFKEHTFDSLFALKKFFPYHFINAQGTIADTEKKIERELLYQSSLELDEDTFHTVKILPTAKAVIMNARQELVARLNDYQQFHTETFKHVVKVIKDEVMTVVRMHVMAGRAHVVSTNPVFQMDLSVQMLIDILSDRGFSVVVEKQLVAVPQMIGSDDHKILNEKVTQHRFIITFDKPTIIHKD